MKARILSALVAVCVVAGGAVTYAATRGESDTYVVTADVEQAPNLFEGGRVMVRGVEVGTITSVEPRPGGVRLSLAISDDVRVPSDARLAIVPITVISDRYVQLYPAYDSGPTLEDGDHLGLDRTSIPAELDDVLAQLKGLLAALEPRGDGRGPLAKLIAGLDEAVAGRSDALGGTLEGSATVLENLADSDSDITAIVRNLDSLFAALANRSSQMALLNERFALVAEALAADQGDIEGTIENLAFLSNEAARLVADSGDDLGRSFARLDRVLNVVLSNQESLTRGIRWNNVIAQALGGTDASGRGLFAYSGRQAAPGTAGAAYNYRIDSRDTVGCERLRIVANSILAVQPTASLDDVADTILNFIPEEFDEDLRFLVNELIPLCTAYQGPALDAQTRAFVRRTAARVGNERFGELLGRWMFAPFVTGSRP